LASLSFLFLLFWDFPSSPRPPSQNGTSPHMRRDPLDIIPPSRHTKCNAEEKQRSLLLLLLSFRLWTRLDHVCTCTSPGPHFYFLPFQLFILGQLRWRWKGTKTDRPRRRSQYSQYAQTRSA
jgi:hypothetical protein